MPGSGQLRFNDGGNGGLVAAELDGLFDGAMVHPTRMMMASSGVSTEIEEKRDVASWMKLSFITQVLVS